MTRDPHVEEHINWDNAYTADAYVYLDDGEVQEPWIGHSVPDPEPTPVRWLNRHRTGRTVRRLDR